MCLGGPALLLRFALRGSLVLYVPLLPLVIGRAPRGADGQDRDYKGSPDQGEHANTCRCEHAGGPCNRSAVLRTIRQLPSTQRVALKRGEELRGVAPPSCLESRCIGLQPTAHGSRLRVPQPVPQALEKGGMKHR